MTAQNREKQICVVIIKSTPTKKNSSFEIINSNFTEEELANIFIDIADKLIN